MIFIFTMAQPYDFHYILFVVYIHLFICFCCYFSGTGSSLLPTAFYLFTIFFITIIFPIFISFHFYFRLLLLLPFFFFLHTFTKRFSSKSFSFSLIPEFPLLTLFIRYISAP